MQQMRQAFDELFKHPGNGNGGEGQSCAGALDFAPHLSRGGRALIVGGRPSNFSEKMRRHPQFVFWMDMTDKQAQQPIPSNAHVVLITKWIAHKQDYVIRKQARERGAFCPPGFVSTGDLSDAFDRFVAHQEEQSTMATKQVERLSTIENVSIAPPQQVAHNLRPPKPGELFKFVVDHGNVDAEPQIAEARRLAALLKESGVETTDMSVANALYRVRHATRPTDAAPPQAEPEPAKPLPQHCGKCGVIYSAGAAHECAKKPEPTKQLPTADLLDGVLATAEDALAESTKALATAQAAHEVLTDAVKRMRGELARFRDQQKAIRQLARQAAEYLE